MDWPTVSDRYAQDIFDSARKYVEETGDTSIERFIEPVLQTRDQEFILSFAKHRLRYLIAARLEKLAKACDATR